MYSPWYRNYSPNVSYNPFLHSSYEPSSSYDPVPKRMNQSLYEDDAAEGQRRALEERLARRAQWLPDEQDDEFEYYDADWAYQQRKQAELARRRAAEMKLEEAQRQQAKQEALRRLERIRQQEELRRQEEIRRKIRQQEAQQRAAEQHRFEQQKNIHNSKVPLWGKPQFVPAGQQEDATMPMPIHVRQRSSSPRQSQPSSPTSKSPEILPTSSEDCTLEQQPRTSSRSPSPEPSHKAQSAHSIEEQNMAAARIQKQFRIHSSLRTLSEIESSFQSVKNGFAFPTKIDFQTAESEEAVTVLASRAPSEFDKEPEEDDAMEVDRTDGKLAFTSTNFALNSYVDALDKILMKLDGVESWGNKVIRTRRRGIVKAVEREASKLERYWRQAWADFIEKQSMKPAPPSSVVDDSESQPGTDAPDAQSMDVDPEPQAQNPADSQDLDDWVSIPVQGVPLTVSS